MVSMAPTRHPRSRTGCWICRLRKKKCDETRPTCQQCQHLKIQCDGYGVAQPSWMRDPAAAKRKKEEIKLQIGKRGRKRRKARARVPEELKPGSKGSNEEGEESHEDKHDLEDSSAAEAVDDVDESIPGKRDGQHFVFEITEAGAELLKPFQEVLKSGATGAMTILDSSNPPIECYRCPIKNSFARESSSLSSYGILDARTGEPLLQDVRSGVILMPKLPPLWKPNNPTVPNTRTKEEEITYDGYDAIIASLMSLATPKDQALLSPAELLDPSLIPPIHFADSHEIILVKHYIRNVFRLTYSGMSEVRIQELLREVIVPFITINPGLLKGCLSSSAIHLAAVKGKPQSCVKELIKDAWEHRISCIENLKARLKNEGASEQTLATILALTSFEVYSSLPNWKYHLHAAIECLVRLDLLNKPTHTASSRFLMSRVIWMDILSALTLGRAPQLWANYREILARPVHERAYCGLLEIMGCDDTVMFLVSEVMCVEDYKYRTLKDGMISWARGSKRAIELDIRLRDRDLPIAVNLPPSPEPPFTSLPLPNEDEDEDEDEDDPTGLLSSPSPSPSSPSSSLPTIVLSSPESVSNDDNVPSPNRTLSRPSSPIDTAASPLPTVVTESIFFSNDHSIPPELPVDQGVVIKATTAAFRTATRIHLWSIGLGFYPCLNFFQQLLEELIVMVALIPPKLSRIVAWPLLVGGCMATEQKDREFFAERCASGRGGSLGGVEKIMREVWKRRDESDRMLGVGCGQEVHWRSVMKDEGLEILLL